MIKIRPETFIEKSLNHLVGNRPIEVRILDVEDKVIMVGYYDNFIKLSSDLKYYIGKYNIYFTINQINEDLIERSYNQIIQYQIKI